MSMRRRPLLVGLVATVIGACVALVGAQSSSPAKQPAAAPKPLVRYAPLKYEVKLENVIAGFPRGDGPALTIKDLALVLPVVINGSTSRVDPKSMQPELWFDSRQDKSLSQRARLDGDRHLGMTWAILPITQFSGTVLRWNVKFLGQSWSVKVNEDLMSRVAWPREWPKEVLDAMKPQRGIESDSQVVQALVKQALGEQARTVPPYYAAKEVVRNVVLAFRGVNTDALERRGLGRVVGMRVIGAADSLNKNQGSTHDVVCACVAALRAAGIPARPVIGVTELTTSQARRTNHDKIQMVSWGEFYLPDAGWIPFDPDILRNNSAVRQLKVVDAWPGVGTMPDLNLRMPVSWSFAPEGLAVPNFPALWSWQGSMSIDSNSLETYTSFTIIPRGKGVDD